MARSASSLEKFHERVKQYYLLNNDSSIPTRNSFVDEYVKKLKGPKKEGYELKRQYSKYYDIYFPEDNEKWIIRKCNENPQLGIGIYSKIKIGYNEDIEYLIPRNASLLKKSDCEEDTVREISINQRCTHKILMRGPLALANHACEHYANVKSRNNEWKSWYADKDIEEGQQLFICYGSGDDESDIIRCGECERERNQMIVPTMSGAVAQESDEIISV
jgi:hypothetical protein